MTTLLVRFADRNHRDETIECDSWQTTEDWFICKKDNVVIFQAQAREVTFLKVLDNA